MAEAIQSSVGVNGVNRAQDVGVIQHLLNVTRTKVGVPKGRLEVDGLFGPLTLAGIKEFQTKFCKLVDGKLVPGGETITKLNQVAPISRVNNGVAFLVPSGPRRTRDA